MNATEQKIHRWQRRGPGKGRSYAPWLTVQRVRSMGLCSRVYSRAAQRAVHLFSQLELYAFYLLDFSPHVVDIREQFPLLPHTETRQIAGSIGVTHPRTPKGLLGPWVLTSDFRVTFHTPGQPPVDRIISVKYASDLRKPRKLRLLEIERVYWERRGLAWQPLTDVELPPVFVANLSWLHPFEWPAHLSTDHLPSADQERACFESLRARTAPMYEACRLTDDHLGLSRGSTLALARLRLAQRRWETDLITRRLPFDPLAGLKAGRGFPQRKEAA